MALIRRVNSIRDSTGRLAVLHLVEWVQLNDSSAYFARIHWTDLHWLGFSLIMEAHGASDE